MVTVYQDIINSSAIFALAWSQGGPPAYSETLRADTQIRGALIVMSPFVPQDLPPLENAQGKAFYILHSPDDPLPISMALQARDLLEENGAVTHLEMYPGGHELPDDILERLRDGFRWLEKN